MILHHGLNLFCFYG